MYQKEIKCPKCGRHTIPVKILKIDPVTKKKWYITTCLKCNYESDLEPYYA